MFCPNCGSQSDDGAAFCSKCGVSLLAPSNEPVKEPQQRSAASVDSAHASQTFSSAKTAKADAKAAKARANALRPWYRKKRVVFPTVVVLLFIIVAVASSNSKNSPGTTGNKLAAGCLANPPKYAGQVPATDCVARANGTIRMAGTIVKATWSRTTTTLGTAAICAAVAIKNNNSGSISYNDLYWQLQTPSGKVEGTDFEAANDLGSGGIVGGGTVTGNVCFDAPDPFQSGTYIGLYQPDAFNNDRGVWLFKLS